MNLDYWSFKNFQHIVHVEDSDHIDLGILGGNNQTSGAYSNQPNFVPFYSRNLRTEPSDHAEDIFQYLSCQWTGP